MTDKPIIIDGVDVSGCRYLFDDTSYKRSKTSCSITLKDCKYLGNNCHYKKLKLKEQECEKLKTQILSLQTMEIEELKNYKETLTEIKKITEVLAQMTDEYENCYDRDRCFECDFTEDCQYFNIKRIIQKISEVEK